MDGKPRPQQARDDAEEQHIKHERHEVFEGSTVDGVHSRGCMGSPLRKGVSWHRTAAFCGVV